MGADGRIFQLDLLKALAIVAVIIQHSLIESNGTMDLHILQAVPVFLIVYGLTSAMSFKKKGYTNLLQMYAGNDFIKRIQRMFIPVSIILLIPLLRAIFRIGPGYYFFVIVIEFIFIFPILYKVYLKNPKLLLILAFILDLAFEVVALYVPIFTDQAILYSISIFRYLFVISLGIWISDDQEILSKRNRFILFGFAISFIYLILSSFFSYDMFQTLWKTQNLIASFYPLMIVLLAIRYFPKESNGLHMEFAALIGKASYHIYLMQILFFGLGMGETILFNIAYCTFMGLAYYLHKDKIEFIK